MMFSRPVLTAVRSELDSGLDTWWLLKNIVFLSGGRESQTETVKIQKSKTQTSAHWPHGPEGKFFSEGLSTQKCLSPTTKTLCRTAPWLMKLCSTQGGRTSARLPALKIRDICMDITDAVIKRKVDTNQCPEDSASPRGRASHVPPWSYKLRPTEEMRSVRTAKLFRKAKWKCENAFWLLGKNVRMHSKHILREISIFSATLNLTWGNYFFLILFQLFTFNFIQL